MCIPMLQLATNIRYAADDDDVDYIYHPFFFIQQLASQKCQIV